MWKEEEAGGGAFWATKTGRLTVLPGAGKLRVLPEDREAASATGLPGKEGKKP